MPAKESKIEAAPAAGWSSREAYLLAMVCLMAGLVMGYLFASSSAPVPVVTAGVQAAATAAAPGTNAMPTAEALAPMAAPLLAALKVDGKNAGTLIHLGNLYFDHQVYAEAIEFYTRALEVRPKEVNVRTDLGTAYWYGGFPEKAVQEYEKSLAIDPTHANTLFNMGVVQLEGMKNPRRAIAAWEKLLATNPQAPQRQRAMELMAKARESMK